jgi:hypothetical protein
MPTTKRLVTEHLEKVSWRVLEDYAPLIKEMIKRRSGIYALYKGQRLYYVGLASNLMGRLKTHLRDRHNGEWDRFSVYLTLHDDHMRELESLLLRIVGPDGNRQIGKFVNAYNYYADLNKQIREFDADHRAEMLGGWFAERRKRAKGRNAKGKGALKGLVPKRFTLKAWKDDWEYTASLRKDGTIQYDGEVFDTPNAAARSALGKPAGGWRFWHYKNEAGEWVPLMTLKSK